MFNKVFIKLEWGLDSFVKKGEVLGLGTDTLLLSIEQNSIANFGKLYLWPKMSKKVFEFSGKLQSSSQGNMFLLESKSLSLYQELLTYTRKHDHIDICLHQDVEAGDRDTGFKQVNFIPNSCPELNFSDLDSSVNFLGTKFDLPILITGMTGGIEQAQKINENLASVASHYKIPMGVGSQRIAIEYPQYKNIFSLKEKFPDIFLLANLGFSEIMGSNDPVKLCQDAITMIAADGLAIHLNVIQECVQLEGNKNFKGFLSRLKNICSLIKVPVMVKEVGSGMSLANVAQFKELGVAAIDVGGKGGTSWGYIEGLRRQKTSSSVGVGETFRNWGIPTAYSICAARAANIPIVATGGIRDGLMVAKAVALGASLAGVGLPLFRAALESREKVFEVVEKFKQELLITMLATSTRKLSDLSSKICLGKPCENIFLDSFRKNQI
jgi:isopentenyl-diphosphate Delta-isomerase